MKKCCGNCRQYERKTESTGDMCSAWGNPTKPDRFACDFWMEKQTQKHRKNHDSIL